jgi:DNA-binding Lrp family transcriptional regulator
MTALEIKPLESQRGPVFVQVRGRLAASTMTALADQVSRKIILATGKASRTIAEICEEQGVPPSTCYRRMNELVREGLVLVDRIVVTDGGRFATYRSCFSAFRVLAGTSEVSVEVTLTPEVADKVRNRWIAMVVGQSGGIAQ